MGGISLIYFLRKPSVLVYYQQRAAAPTWVAAVQRCAPGGTECTSRAANSTWAHVRQRLNLQAGSSQTDTTQPQWPFWLDRWPLLDGRSDSGGSDLCRRQPGLPAPGPLWRVVAEEGLQGGRLVPAHQQLSLRILQEPAHVSCKSRAGFCITAAQWLFQDNFYKLKTLCNLRRRRSLPGWETAAWGWWSSGVPSWLCCLQSTRLLKRNCKKTKVISHRRIHNTAG